MSDVATGHKRYSPQVGSQMSTPNVIPMADIMLVLLIIFMVVTPMLQKDHPVDLARTNTAKDMQDADKDDAIVIAVTRDGNIFLRTTQIRKEEITAQVKDRIANRLDKTVYVKSDARAKYGDVVAVVDEIRSAGVDQVGLLNDRNQKGTPPAARLRRRRISGRGAKRSFVCSGFLPVSTPRRFPQRRGTTARDTR